MTNLYQVFKDIEYEVIHHSGLNTLAVYPEDGSTIELINCVVIPKLWNKLTEYLDIYSEYEAIDRFKKEYLNEFMTLNHNVVVKHQHFNWF